MSDDLERRLAALRPAEVPPELLARLTARKIHWVRFAVPLAAAAVVALVLVLQRPAPRALEPSDLRVFLPVEQTSTLVETHDIALIEADPARPVRLVRATWLDDVTYRGDDGRTLRRQQPRVEFIPVVLETF